MVTPSHGRLTLLDQGSTNGTRVNGKKVKRSRLSHGDTVEIGATRIRVQARTSGGSLIRWPEDTEAFRSPLLPHEQLTLLRRLSARLSICRSEMSAASAVIDISFEAFPVERALVLLRGSASLMSSAEVLAARQRDGAQIKKPDVDHSVVKRVMASGRTERHIAAFTETIADEEVPPSQEEPPKQILCAPMRKGSESVGTLYLESGDMPDWVGSADSLALLSSLADIAGLALGKRKLETRVVDRDDILIDVFENQEDLRETLKVEVEDPYRDGNSSRPQRAPIDPFEGLTGLGEDQQSAVEEIRRNLERRVEERAEVIEAQRIELAARLVELEHLQSTRAMMSRGLVHDIRNLVSALMSNLSFVKLGFSPETEESGALDAAVECARRIVGMAEDVIDVSRMEEGTFPLKTERVQVRRLMADVVQRHRAHASECRVTLELCDIDVHQAVIADPDVFARVLDNLVDNALRYAGDGGRVSLDLSRGRFSTELIVTDTGPGVAPEDRDHIFEEWAQAESKGHTRHRGIGLYFCRLASEAHGGAIRVEGESKNNRFVVSLPAMDEFDGKSHTTDELPFDDADIDDELL